LIELAKEPPNYDAAIGYFIQSLGEEPNDPEALILLNNSIASQQTGLEPVDIATALPLHIQGTSFEVLRGIAQGQIEFNCGSIDNFVNSIEAGDIPDCDGNQGKLLRIEMAGSDESEINLSQNARKVAQYLSSREQVVAVIGHFASTASLQAAPNYADSNLVSISPISTSVKLVNYRDFFRTVPSDALAAQDLARYTTNTLGIENVAIAHIPDGSSAFSESFANEFSQHLPNQSYVYQAGACDLTLGVNFDAQKCMNEALVSGAEAMLLVPDTGDELVTALELVDEAPDDFVFLSGDSVYNERTLDAFNESEPQLWLTAAWHRSNSPFEQDASKLYEYLQVNWRSAMAYSAVKTISGVLQQFDEPPSRSAFLEKLDDMRNITIEEGAAGPIQFDDNGDRIVNASNEQLGVVLTIDPEEGFVQVEAD
ncbi:MAG: ABC transporter substrate-binding protein, partial [Leptolyngbyaceae cyanobacterium]